MRMLKTIVPALIALVVLMTGAPAVAAQDTDPAMPEMDIEGLEKMYGRMFNGDMMAMIETPEGEATGWFMLTTMVLEFDSEDNAKAGFERLNEESTSGAEGEDFELEDVELDLDMDYMAKQAVDESEGMTTNMVVVTAQDGEYVYAVSGMTFGDDPTELVESTVKDMKEADTSDEEEMFQEDGTSMGGLWAKLPTVERVQEQIPALNSVSDIVYYPTQESTPAA